MKAASMPIQSMLNVAPIAPINEEILKVSTSDENKHICDPLSLMQKDQRQSYWRKWAMLNNLDAENVPEPITAGSMSALNVEPLLLHLLVISRFSGPDWPIAADNKNVVYYDILKTIFERNKKKQHFLSINMNEELFFSLMECLGLAAWRGNGRTGGEEDFSRVRKLHLNKEKTFRNYPATNLQSVALNIHTRSGGDEAKSGFEFIHKSFGEYLAARGLLSYALNTAKSLEKVDAEDVEKDWCSLVGSAELSPEITQFLYDEARRMLKPQKALKAKNALAELIAWVGQNGFSINKISADNSWQDLHKQQCCSRSTLVAATSAITSSIPIKWKHNCLHSDCTVNLKPHKFVRHHQGHLLVLVDQIGTLNNAGISRCFRRFNFQGMLFGVRNFVRTNFAGSNFRDCHFIHSLFYGVNIENTDLNKCYFNSCRFFGTVFSNSKLRNADFSNCMFTSVDFSYCDLTEANFSHVDAADRDFYYHTNGWHPKTIRGSIDFNEAILGGANLRHANLAGAINLSLEAINSAIGDEETILPNYIDRSKVVWLQKTGGDDV